MPSTKIKLNKDLYKRIQRVSKVAGYSSVEEFVIHLVEKELSQIEDQTSDEEIVKKLQGLGYM